MADATANGADEKSALRWARSILCLCAIGIGAVHAPLIGYKTYANVDEAYASALGERLNEGFHLYDRAVSQRGPWMYYLYQALARLMGWDNVVGMRVTALLFAWAMLVSVYFAAMQLWSPRGASLCVLVAGYALSVGIPAYDRIALNGEFIQTPFLIIAIGLTARSSAIWWRILLAGALFGIAVGIKQSALFNAAIAVGPILLRRDASRSHRIRQASLLVGGMCMPLALSAAKLAHDHTFTQAWYYTSTFNREVHIAAISVARSFTPLSFQVHDNPLFVLCSGVVFAQGPLALVAWWGRRQIASQELSVAQITLYAHFVAALLTAFLLRRFFPHYFIPATMLLALHVGALEPSLQRLEVRWQLVLGSGTAMLLALSGFETFTLEKIDGEVAHGKSVKKMSAYIEQTVAPEQRIFVWGFSPWLYGYSHRRPAGRYLFSTYPSGVVPWFHDPIEAEQRRIVPNSQELLLQDLNEELPEVVVDAGTIMLGRSMRTYATLAVWLHKGFCFELRFEGYDVYRRKRGLCASDVFPRPDQSYDFAGFPHALLVPRTADADTSAWLPTIAGIPASWAPLRAEARVLFDPAEHAHGQRLEQLQ